MRTRQELINAINEIFEGYNKEFPNDNLGGSQDVSNLMKRTVSRRRTEVLDKAMDNLQLTQEEVDNWNKEVDEENSKRAEDLFENLVKSGDIEKARYLLNNMRSVWSLEKRTEMVTKLGDSYAICPDSHLADTKRNIKQDAKEKARKEAALRSAK